MRTTRDFLDALKARYDVHSDYALVRITGFSKQRISRYRLKEDFLGDESALRVAELLDLDPGYVMACAHAERAGSEQIRRVWERIGERLAQAACLAVPAIAPLSAPSPAHAAGIDTGSICIMSNRRKPRRQSYERRKAVQKLTLAGLLS
ncbi:MAG: DUF3693 domain-containing protein [Pseudomonadota bacterium]